MSADRSGASSLTVSEGTLLRQSGSTISSHWISRAYLTVETLEKRRVSSRLLSASLESATERRWCLRAGVEGDDGGTTVVLPLAKWQKEVSPLARYVT